MPSIVVQPDDGAIARCAELCAQEMLRAEKHHYSWNEIAPETTPGFPVDVADADPAFVLSLYLLESGEKEEFLRALVNALSNIGTRDHVSGDLRESGVKLWLHDAQVHDAQVHDAACHPMMTYIERGEYDPDLRDLPVRIISSEGEIGTPVSALIWSLLEKKMYESMRKVLVCPDPARLVAEQPIAERPGVFVRRSLSEFFPEKTESPFAERVQRISTVVLWRDAPDGEPNGAQEVGRFEFLSYAIKDGRNGYDPELGRPNLIGPDPARERNWRKCFICDSRIKFDKCGYRGALLGRDTIIEIMGEGFQCDRKLLNPAYLCFDCLQTSCEELRGHCEPVGSEKRIAGRYEKYDGYYRFEEDGATRAVPQAHPQFAIPQKREPVNSRWGERFKDVEVSTKDMLKACKFGGLERLPFSVPPVMYAN